MEIKPITSPEIWNEWITTHFSHTPHTQSYEWGDILMAEGKKVERLGIFEGRTIVGVVQLYYNSLPFGWRYAFAPKGPLIQAAYLNSSSEIYALLKDYLLTQKCIFLRIEPRVIPEISALLFKKSVDLHMPTTLLLDLKKTSHELLSEMHQKTRYNVRLAQKKELAISHEKNSTAFWELSKLTSERDQFRLHPQEHYEAMLVSPFTHQLSILYEQKIIVSGIFVGFGDTFSYLHGASDYTARALRAPHLLQWTAIEEAQKQGYAWYDFYGLAPEERTALRLTTELLSPDQYRYNPESEEVGFTHFKLGFGGVVEATPGTWDLILDKTKYRQYTLIRKLRRLLRFIP